MASFTEDQILDVLQDHTPYPFIIDEGDGYTWAENECDGCRAPYSGWSPYHIITELRNRYG